MSKISVAQRDSSFHCTVDKSSMETSLWSQKPSPIQYTQLISITTKSIDQEGTSTTQDISNKQQEPKQQEMQEKKKEVVQEEQKMVAEVAKLNSLSIRYQKFKSLLEQTNIDFDQLRKLAWPGIPEEIRPTVWKLLMVQFVNEGYLPGNSDRRDATLQRKRSEYEAYVTQAYARGQAGLDQALSHQIHIDIQRTNAHVPLYQNPTTQECLERVLYIWAIRHPASGYVQGINDLLTPFFQVFLQEFVGDRVDSCDPSSLPKETLMNIESDAYWCLTKLLDGIQDNYTHAQPGITRQIARLKELINRIDQPLVQHLEAQGVEFIQFAFRWMNCLLMREISLRNTIRMWDSYLVLLNNLVRWT